jgi:hypothetical protein
VYFLSQALYILTRITLFPMTPAIPICHRDWLIYKGFSPRSWVPFHPQFTKVPPVSYLNFTFLPVIYQLVLPVECYLDSTGMTYKRSGMWGFVGETIGECRNVNLMDQKVIPDKANKNKQKWNVNKITSLRNTRVSPCCCVIAS